MSSFLNILQRNNLVKSALKSFIPIETRVRIYNFLNKDSSIRLYFENNPAIVDPKNGNIQGLMPVYYWDGKPNFGDAVGPYLISKITGKPVLNVKNLQYPGIMAVGSIIQMLDRENMVIWGSGLMYKLTNEQLKAVKKYNPTILSVRGQETAKHLLEAGIDIPDKSAYGDPALILPLFYSPLITGPERIGLCPHYTHKPYFLKTVTDKDNFKIIDVQNDMETVVNSISSSSVCISTSLHGLIIAQAYKIPWVWLEIFDNNLTGNDFKFKDFFSTLNESQISHVRVSMEDIKDIDFKILAEKATLPDKLYKEELILESLKIYLDKVTEL